MAVTEYLLERCLGTSCSDFAQIAAPTSTSYADTALNAATTYRYRVRAGDAAGNLSGYSAIAAATTENGSSGTLPLGALVHDGPATPEQLSLVPAGDRQPAANRNGDGAL